MIAKYEFIDAEKANHAIVDMCVWRASIVEVTD
ncbi:hypothetical protein H4W34_000223 [Actinomadura algeriensis]|uniref:Uncharacterized protein n=1 Tax=Actinomadura algeriensis TaxID=1679523 RepID=A0ABR9JIK8_9ACTN|nr:hypothetical protein [Actinomadura algeriensis]